MEAVTNAFRHSGGGDLHGLAAAGGRRAAPEVRDDGGGLAAGRRLGVGLSSMRERAEELGGTCSVTSTPGRRQWSARAASRSGVSRDARSAMDNCGCSSRTTTTTSGTVSRRCSGRRTPSRWSGPRADGATRRRARAGAAARRGRDGPAHARLNGIEATARIVASSPHIGVLVLTMMEDEDSVFAAVRAGARGYLLKGARRSEILRAIEAVGSGEVIFGPGIADRVMAYFRGVRARPSAEVFPELTERERVILGADRRGQGQRRDRPRAGPVGQDRAQPREQHLHQAPGGPPCSGDRDGAGGRSQ